jgi:hypothetical protein
MMVWSTSGTGVKRSGDCYGLNQFSYVERPRKKEL